MAFSPVSATKDITEKYNRYLSTIFSFADKEYQSQFMAALDSTPFAKGPFLELTDSFEKGRSINEMIAHGELPKSFNKLGFPLERPLYLHQIEAYKKVRTGSNVVVSTGTGSGKTESFLLPIMNDLVKEVEEGTINPGVRALLIYPMNALANDQVERLRKLIKDYPEITFGCYTGQTLEEYKDALVAYQNINGGNTPIVNELICRQQMKKTPPHILITNYAMLEYLMVRPDDSVFFESNNVKHWKYIVLDEAHVYKGSTGIEVSMLLRRLKTKLQVKNMQYILTSATLGSDDDNKAVADFAGNLCNSSFCENDVVRAKRIKLIKPEGCKLVEPEFYDEIANLIMSDASDSKISEALNRHFPNGKTDFKDALYDVVYNDQFYWEIRKCLMVPRTVSYLLNSLNCTEKRLTNFVTVATKAVRNDGKLFDARYHMFLRAAESIFITLAPTKKLFLEARKTYTENGKNYKVFEVATCNHCHAIYLLGENKDNVLEQVPYLPDSEPRTAYLLNSTINDSDDEHTLDDAGVEVETFELCGICGSINRKGAKHFCDHQHFVIVQKVTLKGEGEKLTKCPCCENVSPVGVLRQFFVGQEAVTSVIGSALFEALPSYTVKHIEAPKVVVDEWGFGEPPNSDTEIIKKNTEAKQFIAFSDSRQAAAFYATYLDQTYRNILYKRLVVETLKRNCYATTGKNMEDFVEDLMAMFEELNIVKNQDVRKEAWKAILHEAMDNNGVTSLYNMGLIKFDLDGNMFSGNGRYNLTKEEVHQICALFTDWMMSEGAIKYSQPMNKDEREFFAHNGIEHNYTLSDANPQKLTLSFLPSKVDFSNKRIKYLEKVLNKTCKENVTDDFIKKLLTGLWEHFFKGKILTAIGSEYRVDSSKIIVKHPDSIFRCKKCHRITTHNVRNVCPSYRCDGELEELDINKELSKSHYYRLYNEMEIRPLRVVEHTAQLDKDTAYNYQLKFKKKEIDILSCSTTFEMGVDVGDLETVFMRNVPPSPANYAQRAGRAGRSLYSAAFALTFCNKSNHDFSFFRNPERMIKGKIEPPVFNVSNPKIAIRHIFATAFSMFWKQNRDMFNTMSYFVDNEGLKLFKDYLDSKPEQLKNVLKEFLPNSLVEYFGVDNFEWVEKLIGDEGIFTIVIEDYQEIIRRLEIAANEAFAEGKKSDSFTERKKVFQKENLLTFLARKNIFPKYGFPVDTVELLINDKKSSQMVGVQLQRDLSTAISEYAPGAQVVANGKLITSRYIRKRPDRSWKMSRYNICECCGDLNLSFYDENKSLDATSELKCANCGNSLNGSKTGVYLIPEFGFEADGSSLSKPGLKKPVRTYRSEVSYVGGKKSYEVAKAVIGNAECSYYVSKSEEMAVLNRSRFFVCRTCGYTELDDKRFTHSMKKKHNRPSGYPCSDNVLENFSLAYHFETDIFVLKFLNIDIAQQEEALSILYGLLEGMSRALEIERNDISGCLQWFFNKQTKNANYAFVLYDKTPGGAGHVSRLNDAKILEKVFEESLKFVSSCTCGGELRDTSCYSCLKNYYNQKHHEVLQRRYVIDFLTRILVKNNDC